MNFSVSDSLLGRQRCRQWTPLLTQQLRLRHLYQIMAYNLTSECSGSFYYTLHLTTMCSPFYTSEKSDSLNPKWAEFDAISLPYPSISGFVLRIWQTQESDMDVVITTWGINLSGLIYLGIKLSEIQPESFKNNSVIFYLRGGFFTSYGAIRTDLQKPLQFIDNLNLLSTEFETKVYRNSVLRISKTEVKQSYMINKLQKLHSLQLAIRNQSLDVEALRGKITNKCGLCNSDEIMETPLENPSPIHRHASQLLTMTTLNKMLHWQEKPTKLQRQQIGKASKQLEIAKFRTKLLSQERDKKSANIRHLKQKCSNLIDENEERGSLLMENYRKLSRDSEKLKEWRKEYIQLKELLMQTNTQLHHRRRQLMTQILYIYPMQQVGPRKCLISGIYLPDSDMLSDCSDGGLAVALGYVSHILVMCASFLQVPLRYPITFLGSRSHITDHITAALADKDRDFPLYAKGKDRMQFNYAVYLLNKNIAQLRWLCGQHTPDLRATLPNLQSLLQGRESKDNSALRPNSANKLPKKSLATNTNSDRAAFNQKNSEFNSPFDKSLFGLASHASDPILDTLRQEYQVERSHSPTNRNRKKSEASSVRTIESKPGLSEILAIPEAFLNQQISTNVFKSYISEERFKHLSLVEDKQGSEVRWKVSQSNSETKSNASCDTSLPNNRTLQNSSETPILFDMDGIEQGTDILHSSLNLTQESKTDPVDIIDPAMPIVEERPKSIRLNRDNPDRAIKQNRRISRSVGSITEEEEGVFDLHNNLELGSDPLLNVSSDTAKSFNSKNLDLDSLSANLEDGQQEFLQKWLDSGSALVCSDENLYPDEILGNTVAVVASTSSNSPLTLRTDALLNTTSFNLIKPK